MEGIFDFLVPQAVDKWIQHGDHCCVKHRHHFIDVKGETCTRSHINKEKSTIQDGDGCQVRRAGGEGFAPPIGRVDPQDGCEDVNVGDQDSHTTEDSHRPSHNENYQLIDPSVSTHKGKQGGHIAEEMIDDIGATKRETKCIGCMSHGVHEPDDIGTNHQLDTESLGHGNGIQ